MKTVELEVEKIRAVRYRMGQKFHFNSTKLGEYYREQEETFKTDAQRMIHCLTETAKGKQLPQD